MTRAERAWAVLDGVPDPEVPALSVRDLGIVGRVALPRGGDGGGLGASLDRIHGRLLRFTGNRRAHIG